MSRKIIVLVVLLFMLSVSILGCEGSLPGQATAEPAATATQQITATAEPTQAPVAARILSSYYTEDYLSPWEIVREDVSVYAEAPGGTGGGPVQARIITSDGREKQIGIGAFSNAFLSGDWLYYFAMEEDDFDSYDYGYSRLNVTTLDEPEELEINYLMASDHYFYYWRGEENGDLYRVDGDFANEILLLKDMENRWAVETTESYLLVYDDYYEGSGKITIYDEDGKELYQVEPQKQRSSGALLKDGVLYWADQSTAPQEPVCVNKFDIATGQTASIEGTLDIIAETDGVSYVEDGYIYVCFYIPYREDMTEEEMMYNIHLYKMPQDGGDLEFVRKWFES